MTSADAVQGLETVEHFLLDAANAVATAHPRLLMKEVRQSGRPRSGTLSGGVAYLVHGAGCRYERSDGVIIDLDLHGNNVVFNIWTVMYYARSRDRAIPKSVLREACEHLVTSGRLQSAPDGWFILQSQETPN